MTCLAINHTGKILYTGSWDKTILAFNTESRQVLRKFDAHLDFVKCLLYLPPRAGSAPLLLSGSSDASIIVWNAETGAKLHTLKGHTRGVTSLALDPISLVDPDGPYVVLSGGSERDIRQWTIFPSGVKAFEDLAHPPIIEHDTSVYKLRFSGDDAEELWTASADNFARRIDIRGSRATEESFKHPDFVNDIVVDERWGLWVVTACRDENVRVWEKGSGKLHFVYEGHYEEVTGLCIVGGEVVSVGIDCTVRRWSLEPSALKRAVEERRRKEEEEAKGEKVVLEKVMEKKESLLTAEEEAELAELMMDSDED